MTRVLVTGARGFIGQRLCSVLRDKEFLVRRAIWKYDNKQDVERDCGGYDDFIIDSIDDHQEWDELLIGVDAVVHLAARVHITSDDGRSLLEKYRTVNVRGTMNLARAAAKYGVKRFVFMSTIGVHGRVSNHEWFNEKSSFQPNSDYAISKLEAEDALRKLGSRYPMEVVIIRPPLVYGPGAKGNFQRLMRLIDVGVPLPLNNINNRRSFIGIDNLIDFIVRCVADERAAGETFVVSDVNVSTTELVEKLGNAMGTRVRLFSIPKSIFKLMTKLLRREPLYEQLFGSLMVDSTKAQQCLLWTPSVSVEEQINSMTKHYLASKRNL